MTSSLRNGFISIQLLIGLVVIGLICIIVLWAYSTARATARDERRLIDIAQIQKAFLVYSQENGFYPFGNGSSEPTGLNNYLDYWPTPPTADGRCTLAQNKYSYVQKSGGDDYQLTFCLGVGAKGLSSGMHSLSTKGIQ